MAEAKVKIRIGSEAQLSGFDKLKNALATAGSKVKSWAKGIGSNLMNIKAGFDMLKGAISSIGSIFKKAFDAQTMTHQFKTLLGSMDEAKQHMEMLKELGDTPPFSLEEFAAASRSMLVFSEGALGMEDSLTLVGDAAAATGKPIEEVGQAVAKAYAIIRDGQPVSRATAQLRNMGLITPEVAAKLNEMQKAGSSNIEIWNALESSLKKYDGAMKETESTVNGAIGALGSAWDDAIRSFGGQTTDALAGPLNDLAQWIHELDDDGVFESWGESVANVLETIYDAAKKALSVLKAVSDHLREGMDDEAPKQQFDEKASWELLSEEKINPYKTKRTYKDINGQIVEEYEVNERLERKWLREKEKLERQAAEKKRKEEQMAAKDAERKAAAEVKAAEKAAKEKAKLEEQEKKRQEKAAKEKAKLEEQEKKRQEKEDKKAEEERKKRLKEEADQQIKFETQLHDAKMQAIEDEIKEEEKSKKAFDDKIKRGIEGEKSRRHDGQSRVKLDPDTGLPQSVADMQRAERFAKNGTKEQGKAARRAAADEKRASKLEEQLARGGKISKGDQKFLDALKELNKRREADKRMKELNEQKDKAVLDIKKTVDDIKLGLEQNLKVK